MFYRESWRLGACWLVWCHYLDSIRYGPGWREADIETRQSSISSSTCCPEDEALLCGTGHLRLAADGGSSFSDKQTSRHDNINNPRTLDAV